MGYNARLSELAKETVEVGNKGVYVTSDGKSIDIRSNIEEMVGNTFIFCGDGFKSKEVVDKLYSLPYNYKNNVMVTERTTCDAIKHWCKEGKKVVALNFAGAKGPGGRFLDGYNTQEESITRVSTLYKSLTSKIGFYVENRNNKNRGLYENWGIYSPKVVFIRDMGTQEEDFMEPIFADIITCAAVSRRAALRNGISEELIELTNANRIDIIFKTFIEYIMELNVTNSVLVLGAFGCGVFKNKANVVSKLFKAVINKYDKELKEMNVIIDFAIPGGKNLVEFKSELS